MSARQKAWKRFDWPHIPEANGTHLTLSPLQQVSLSFAQTSTV